MSEKIWDILGFGIVAVDDVLIVDSYPPPDSKVEIISKNRYGGGLTGTALVAASRLGAKCAYAGVVGNSELSKWTIDELTKEGIDCSPVIIVPESQPFHAIVIVDRTHNTRNIFYTSQGVMTRPLEEINEELISKTKIVFVDQLDIDGMLKAAIIARRLGIQTVADIERDDHPRTKDLLEIVDHLIISTAFARKLTGSDDPVDQVMKLHESSKRLCTAVTAGDKGCWYVHKDGEVKHQPAFKVQVVDTTGCGDVFHGAYSAGIAWGWSVPDSIKFASATAAIKATKPGGRSGIPNKETVEEFLKTHD